ncbi:unnamed protein product [Brachionus calyciflorus]|uniref:PH domain-containing protein n=1 Tax=Brachionus calyciflorus TaxID=104777 RepID=A0A813RNH7_9BILA|nr:unnamed protein product [Brachionus calyciflorus]
MIKIRSLINYRHNINFKSTLQQSNRKVCKYGYLFIAPSDLELNKTKRWQWRFFIFHEDGELTYSLDDNPLTVPQGRINMAICENISELCNQSDVNTSSYPNSLCLKFAKPLKDIYIAAGNYEEMVKWKEAFCTFGTKCQKKNFVNSKKIDDHPQAENENVPERDTQDVIEVLDEDDSKQDNNSESNSENSSRRLSYKEDDLLRKQRLKENLNQLLIEYKHEEEANMKKMSKQTQQNRQSLPQTNRNKSSAFSLVVAPQNNSAFRPVTSLTNLLSSNNQSSLPLQIQPNNKMSKTQSSSAVIQNITNSPSSSWSSSSSSNSPPKTRQNEDYKKPCLISPRKQQQIEENSQPVSPNLSSSSSSSTSSAKSLTILVQSDIKNDLDTTIRNIEIIDLTKNKKRSNLVGYLWKMKEPTPNEHTSNQFNKYWFSLNLSLSCLIYWNDKYEQELGKFPLGKYELTKCCSISVNEGNDFKLTFHQNTVSITLRTSSFENKVTWCDSIRNCIENQSNQCPKCKPKLVVNPMPAFSNNPTPTDDQNQSVQNDTQNYEILKNQYDKLVKENSDLSSKFKILEQFHLDSIGEYDRQQTRLYNQIDDMTVKINKSEQELDLVNKKFGNIKLTNEEQLNQIKKLNETILEQEKEIEKLNKKLSKQLSNNSSSDLGWNKEVKNLDARISDVLGKIKERELCLAQKSDENLKIKFEKLQSQLADAQKEILNLKSIKNSNSQPDYGDDLTKVLMSKEEVITQLEAQLRDKDRQIFDLTLQLNEEISKTDKFQDAFNFELDRNTQLKNLTENLNEHYADELSELKDELKKSQTNILNLESNILSLTGEKKSLDTELKNLQEYSKNEIESLQEEVKTLEFKFVHSQRQAHEYQSILEDMDLGNTQTINQLNSISTSLGGGLNNFDLNSINNLQGRLKRNQSFVNILIQQILELKEKQINELKDNLNKLQSEFDEIKEENIDLNDHIYSIDVYMREKEAECDQLKKEKDDLVNSLNAQIDDPYKSMLNNLTASLKQKTKNIDGLIKFCENVYLSEMQLNEIDILNLVPDQDLIDCSLKKKLFKNNGLINLIKTELNSLIVYLNSRELNEFNSQITSYMAEQLVHKSVLNGNLKFACDILRKKLDSASESSTVGKIQSPSGQVLNKTNVSEQDEKIFKLASELLLSDEDSLRKLSSQVLNEVQHLTQLNCVLNTLKKLRLKYLRSVNCLGVLNKIYGDLESMDEGDKEINNENKINDSHKSDSDQMNCILEVMRDIFIQHKNQVSEQLNEVHKLMSISSDDDLVTHLQNENSILKDEIKKLKDQMNSSKTTSNLVDKKLTNWMLNTNPYQSKLTTGSQLRKFGFNTENSSNSVNNQKNSINNHILTDLLSQDDTMC